MQIIIPRLGWRWLLAVSSVPCFAAFIFYFFTIETPRYLYLNGKITEAQDVLKRMAVINRTELPSGKLVSEKIGNLNEDFTPVEGNQLLPTRERETNTAKPGCSSILTLFSPSLVKTTLLLWVVYFGNSFSYYGVVLMTSELSSGERKCRGSSHSNLLSDSSLYVNVFITSFAGIAVSLSTVFLLNLHVIFLTREPYLFPELPGLVLSAILVDNIGRRMSMVVMYSCGFLCLLPLMFQQKEAVAISLLFGARMFVTGNFTVAGIYCPEVSSLSPPIHSLIFPLMQEQNELRNGTKIDIEN